MRQYLIETVMIKVQNNSDSTPSALCGEKCPPVACTTVCSVYKGLVPRSPNTTPSAPSAAHCEGRAARADSLLELLFVMAPPQDLKQHTLRGQGFSHNPNGRRRYCVSSQFISNCSG